ncbi:MAG: glycosyltransferase [Candidatus Staskawiczbacteria bacterium]|nr:glycosyltransferase [Candidatus Staskawiczbacteria bacterium]
MRILFTGGGTGGHVFPIVAIVREIRRIYQRNDLDFYYIGPKDEFGLILLAQEGFLIKTIISGKIRRYLSFENL